MKPSYLVVNGILSKPGDINGWTDLFEDEYEDMGYTCKRYEYFSSLIRWKQSKRVKELTEIIKRSSSKIIYVGHSNGCELFSRLIKETDCEFQAAHLFAPAMDSDCNVNGINLAILSKRVNAVYAYCSKKDLILKNWASKTSFLKFIRLGYGTAGYSGFTNILPEVEGKFHREWSKSFNHSDWFKPKKIKDSIELTLRKY